MILHSGAGLHGHEYSHNSNGRNLPLGRTLFSTPMPRISISRYSSAETRNSTTKHVSPSQTLSNQDRGSTLEPTTFIEPELDTMSEDGRSFANSEGSQTSAGGALKRRKSIRPSTTYHLAHPAPTLTQKQKLLHIRPRLLLQLQRVSASSRPVPTIDVLPASVVVPRLAMKFPRMFKGKGELGVNDVMIVKSEEYTTFKHEGDTEALDCDSMAEREVLAVICQVRSLPGSTEICLSDGSKWFATPSAKGGFEFTYTDRLDGNKTVARWVPRGKPKRDSVTEAKGTPEPRYSFSILDPRSRRHPVLASMTQSTLSIPDFYSSVPASPDRHLQTEAARQSLSEGAQYLADNETHDHASYTIDDSTKTLIQATAVWVALRQGWCHSFSYHDGVQNLPAKTNTPSSSSGKRVRSSSVNEDSISGLVNDTGANTPESNHGSLRDSIGGRVIRSGTQILRGNSSPTFLANFDPNLHVPNRSVSTGTAFMRRTAARRASNLPSHVPPDSEVSVSSLSAPGMSLPASTEIHSRHRISNSWPLASIRSSPSPDTPANQPFRRRLQSMLRMPHQNTQAGWSDGHSDRVGHEQCPGSGLQSSVKDSGPQPPARSKGSKWKKALGFFLPG